MSRSNVAAVNSAFEVYVAPSGCVPSTVQLHVVGDPIEELIGGLRVGKVPEQAHPVVTGVVGRHGGQSTAAGGGPTYRAAGRMILPARACSSAWAVQPSTRATANVAVNISGGTPAASITSAA